MKRLILSIAIFIIAVIAIKLIVAFGGDMVVSSHNVSTFTSKSKVNGNIKLTIGTLKGTYEVEDFTIKTDGKIDIPFESTVESGNVSLFHQERCL